jgi:membrane dipeptidase
MEKKTLGLTGHSSFTEDCISMIEEKLKCNFVLLYHNKISNLENHLKNIHGVIFAGGIDIHPSTYGEPVYANSGLTGFDLKRDQREIFCLHWCFDRKIPVMGICRGHQLIGIYHNIGVLPDIQGYVAHSPYRNNIKLTKGEPMHKVSLLKKTRFEMEIPKERNVFRLAGLCSQNEREMLVNSYHHQGLIHQKSPPPDVEVMGIAETGQKDVPQIVELMRGEHWISCQWHPEVDWEINTPSCTIIEEFKKILLEQ